MPTRKRSNTQKTLQLSRMLKAYPNNHSCTINGETESAQAQLIAINFMSARVKCLNATVAEAFRYNTRLTLHTGISHNGTPIKEVPCQVAWRHNGEIGLEFDSTLQVGILDLQNAFRKKSA